MKKSLLFDALEILLTINLSEKQKNSLQSALLVYQILFLNGAIQRSNLSRKRQTNLFLLIRNMLTLQNCKKISRSSGTEYIISERRLFYANFLHLFSILFLEMKERLTNKTFVNPLSKLDGWFTAGGAGFTSLL